MIETEGEYSVRSRFKIIAIDDSRAEIEVYYKSLGARVVYQIIFVDNHSLWMSCPILDSPSFFFERIESNNRQGHYKGTGITKGQANNT